MQSLIGSFEVLLEAIVADAAQKVSELPLMGRRELWEWREGWNQTACLERGKNTVAGLVSHAARTHASAVAIDAADGRLTYTELEAQSNRLAHLFAARGFRPGSLAGVALARSSRMMVVLLAIRKLGAAYLPLDTSHPADRLTFIAQDAGIEWLITERAVAAQAPQVSSTLLLEDLWQQLQSATEEFPGPEDDPERPAYVRYTSGSSGKPKGVVVPERAIVNFLRSMQQRPGIVHDDCLLAVTTLSFDISELELWLPLIVGGRLALATREDAIDPARLSALLVRSGATVMQATPATWSMLVTSGWQGSRNLKALCGGEALPPELAGHLLTRSAELWNLYGPTETTVWSSIARVDAPSAIRLGDPIANTQLYVCDAHLRPVPVGAIGELLIAGEGLATGYLHRPELTAEKFVQLSSAGGAKAYRTGDLVRRRADGTLDYVGRGDEQVKLRGFRIELGEIEAVLSRCAGVEACVVMLREDTPGHKRLVAYVVVKPGEQGSESEWWADLKAGLPEYMLPAAFVRVERLPLSPNGKIDRKQLPPPDQGEFRSAEHVQALRTPTEELLANIWSGVLHVNDIGPDSHFFQMGGHSLTATQLVSRVRQAFRVELPLRAVFASPVLSSMATSIDQLAQGESNIPPPIIGVPRDRP